jgi:hypothetical protein
MSACAFRPDLHAEFDCASANFDGRHIEHCTRHGLPFWRRHLCGSLGVERIRTSGALYEPDAHGRAAYVVGAWWPEPPGSFYPWQHPPELLDLIAFDLCGAWWQRTGDAMVLGEHVLAETGGAVPVVASPLEYVRAGGRAVLHLQPVREAA